MVTNDTDDSVGTYERVPAAFAEGWQTKLCGLRGMLLN